MIVAHELFGVTPQVRGVADELAGAGYLAIAPEYYHRAAPAGRWLERDAAGREEGFGYLRQLERQQAVDDTAACMGWASAEHGCVRTGMIGFSAGGHLAYLAACLLPIDRTAVLYGGWLPGTDIPLSQPTPTLDLTPGISGRLLYLVGEDDFLIGADQRRQIAAGPAGGGHRPRDGELSGRGARLLVAGHARVRLRAPGTTRGAASSPCSLTRAPTAEALAQARRLPRSSTGW